MNECLDISNDILAHCHPDAVSTVKNWQQALKTRWNEVSDFAKQRGDKLEGSLDDLRTADAQLEGLLQWITTAEGTLNNQEKQPVPENIPIIEQLMNDHQVC